MAEPTRLVRDGDYEEMGASYQCVQVAVLYEALKKSGIKDAKVREKICKRFVFEMGQLHDHGWLKPGADAQPVYPVLCFTKSFMNVDTPVDSLGDVYAPSTGFSFHEYAFGAVGGFYEGDPAAQVETGDFPGDA